MKPTVLETVAVVGHENMDHQGTLNISIYFWQKSWAEIDCKRSVIQSVREQKREKEWETRTNLGFEISQVPFCERSCKEYILCICTPPALQPPLWSLTSPISGSLLLLHPQIIWIHLTSTDQINSNRILLLHGRSQGQPHLHLDT